MESWTGARASKFIGAATEMMLDLAGVQQAAECLTLRQARVSQLLWQLSALEEEGTYWRRIILLAC